MKKLIIAVDGHSSCGKSTFAKLIASNLSYVYIDTGAMYRAVTYYAIVKKFINKDGINEFALLNDLLDLQIDFRFVNNKLHTFLNGGDIEKEIRSIEVSNSVSLVSKIEGVRKHLVMLQQKMGAVGSVVMDGRDIGTVVFPNADIKLFMTASIDIRAVRRYKELAEKGEPVELDDVKKNLMQRDHIDSTREISPLKIAEHAVILDNSTLSIEAQWIWFESLLRDKDYMV